MEPWAHINEYIKRERDAFRSSVTHIQLAYAAIVIISVLLSAYSFLNPILKISQLEKGDIENGQLGLFLMGLGLTIGIILLVVLYTLSIIRRRLIKSLEEELLCKAQAILSASDRFEEKLPSATLDLLKGIERP